MADLLDGRLVSDLLLEELRLKIENYPEKPTLAIILVGNNPASISYIKQKQKSADKIGLDFKLLEFPDSVSQESLISEIHKLNANTAIHGIIVQLPLPINFDTPKVLKEVTPRKDVDGFHAYNVGKMFLSKEFESLVPCTPKGVIRLLSHYGIDLKGKEVVVVGHSNIVGKPMAVMLLNRDATVTVCHKETKDLKNHTLRADILITAVGKPGLITEDMVKDGAIVVDVGCTKVGEKLFGDVDFEPVSKKSSYITPVPGGVGPMTVACLIENTVIAYDWLKSNTGDFITKF